MSVLSPHAGTRRTRGGGKRYCVVALAMLALGLGMPRGSLAQDGVITGRVVDAESTAPLSGVAVELISGMRVVRATTTDATGTFRLTGVPAGSYSLVISSLGYETKRQDGVFVRSGAGALTLGSINLASRALQLNPIVVTASRDRERSLEAPASVHTVSPEEIQERSSTTSVDHIRGTPGVDIAKTGLQQHNVVARGFNNVFSSALFVLHDYRWASVPSLRLNAYNLIPTTNEDIERIEVVLGPGSALYGPNVDKGVMHILTRSPLEYQGTTASIAGGERELFQGTFRHADVYGEDVGVKLSGMYFRGQDWKFTDPVEAEAREDTIDALVDAGADTTGVLVGLRDFTAERLIADARVDVRVNESSTLVFSSGLNWLMRSIEMTGIGTAQAEDWIYSYIQARFRSGDFFAQTYLNFSDAGDSYTLRDGSPVVDNSLLYVGQVQHASEIGERQRFIYGADLIRTVPRTDGTIHGRNEDDDNIFEVGGYVQSETALSPHFDLVLAGRLDYHDIVDDVFVSPRAALVIKPTQAHNFRLTYNRAFSQPTSVNLSLDLQSAGSLGPFDDFAIRAIGVPRTGFTFRRDCNGLCMRSPFAADSSAFLPLDVTPFWDDAIVGLIKVIEAQGLDPLDPALEMQLRSLDPSGQVSTVLRRFSVEALAFGPITPQSEAVTDVAPLEPSVTNTFEVGYKGLIGNRLLLGVDVYYQRVEDFIGPLRFETANAFLHPLELGEYLAAAGVPPAEIPTLIALFANVPLATVTPEQVPAASASDLYVTYRNFGDVDFLGMDLGFTFLLTDRVSATGSYSLACGWIDSDNRCENFFPNLDDIGDISLNAPRNKATLATHYRDPRAGIEAEVRGRYVDSYPVASGVFEGHVESFALLDLNVRYELPLARSTAITLTVNNVFDNRHIEMAGAPEIGRLALLRVSRTF